MKVIWSSLDHSCFKQQTSPLGHWGRPCFCKTLFKGTVGKMANIFDTSESTAGLKVFSLDDLDGH